MTVNELEQALRNLIASQPVVTSGPSGDFINSALSIVYSYREFLFKVQNHPFQDALKFNMLNISQKLESDLVISVCGVMQERGINLMLYAPSNQYGAGVMQPNFQGQMNPMQNVGMNPMMYNGQVNSYNQMNMQPQMMGQMPPQGYAGQPRNEAIPTYAYANEQPKPAPVAKTASKRTAPAFSKAAAPTPQVKSASTKAATPKPKEEVVRNEEQVETTPQQPKQETSSKQDAVNALLGEYQNDEPTGKAAGRDYLLELLKK